MAIVNMTIANNFLYIFVIMPRTIYIRYDKYEYIVNEDDCGYIDTYTDDKILREPKWILENDSAEAIETFGSPLYACLTREEAEAIVKQRPDKFPEGYKIERIQAYNGLYKALMSFHNKQINKKSTSKYCIEAVELLRKRLEEGFYANEPKKERKIMDLAVELGKETKKLLKRNQRLMKAIMSICD